MWNSIVLRLDEVRNAAPVRGREGLVPRAVEKGGRIRVGVRGDFMELPLKVEAEVIEVKIVQVVVEGIFNLLSNLEKAEEQERCKRGTRDRVPSKWVVDLEGKEDQVQPEGHPEMSLVSKGKGSVPDALKIGESVLEHGDVIGHTRRERGLDKYLFHQ